MTPYNWSKWVDRTVHFQSKLNHESIARVRCQECGVDYLDIIKKGKTKILLCEHCEKKECK